MAHGAFGVLEHIVGDDVTWSLALSVGIDELDAQHRALLDLLNQLHSSVTDGLTRQRQLELLGELAEYTKIHFAVEESLMRIFGYPDYERHKTQHEGLIRNMVDLQQRLDQGREEVDAALMRHLRHWLIDHILQSDQDYSRFFLAAGALAKHAKPSWSTRIWDHLQFCSAKCWS
nr:bacteriohemerythrin [Thiocapsa imhoffii]